MATLKTEIKRILRRAEEQGFVVREAKHCYIVFSPDDAPGSKPCTIGHTPSSSRTLANFVACLKRKGVQAMRAMEQRAWITIEDFPSVDDEAAWEPFADVLDRDHADVGAILSWHDRNVAQVVMSADLDDRAQLSRLAIVRVTEALEAAGLGDLYPSGIEIVTIGDEHPAAAA